VNFSDIKDYSKAELSKLIKLSVVGTDILYDVEVTNIDDEVLEIVTSPENIQKILESNRRFVLILRQTDDEKLSPIP
jgi:hypothetical protein